MKKQLNLKTADLLYTDAPCDGSIFGTAFGFKFDSIPFILWVDVYGTFDEELIDYFSEEYCEYFISEDKKLEFFEDYLEMAYNFDMDCKITKEEGNYFVEYEEN